MKKSPHKKKEETAMDETTFQQTWQEIETRFREAEWHEPAEGFAMRWQDTWQQAEARSAKVRSYWVVGANALSVLLMVAASGLAVWQMMQGPVAFFYSTIGVVLEFAAFLAAMFRVTISVLLAIPVLYWMIFGVASLALLGLWAKLFQQGAAQASK